MAKKVFTRKSLQKYRISASQEVQCGEWTFLIRSMTRKEYKIFLRMLQESDIARDAEGNVTDITPEQVEHGLAVVDYGLSTCVVDEDNEPVFPEAAGIDQLSVADVNTLFQAIMQASNPKGPDASD